MKKNTYDLAAKMADEMATAFSQSVDFEAFYAPSQEDYELALDLNAGKKISDMRTRGAKMLKKLKDKAREEWFAPQPH